MPGSWRLILDGPVDGALNMALDRAAQIAREAGAVPSTLRLYRWSRPTVTLGRFQDAGDVDVSYCAASGVDVVRRFTGGRGVLHDDEITYSVVASLSDGIPPGVARSYRHLSRVLADAYRELGVAASITEHDRGSARSSACYLATTRADLALGASKLSGSAQVWTGSTVMQHGSFVRSRDVSREARAFRLSPEESALLEQGTSTLESALGALPDAGAIEAAVAGAFDRVLGVSLRAGEWTALEAEMAAGLLPEVVV